MKSPTSYVVRPETVAAVLSAIAAVLVVLHLVAMQVLYNDSLGLADRFGIEYWQVALFDLDQESALGTWFAAALLLIAAVLLLHQSKVLRMQGSSEFWWWRTLGILFCVLSIDEVAGMHEELNTALENTGTDWTLYGFVLLVAVAVAYLPFLWRYRWRLSLLFVLAGLMYGAGAVGVEHFSDAEVETLHYSMWVALEEGMEKLGVIILIYAILDHLRGERGNAIRVDVGLDDQAAGD